MSAGRPTSNAELVSKLMSRIEITDSGCWEYTGYRNRNGYGEVAFGVGSSTMGAHRLAWWLRYGDPGDLFVLHHCDNPPCVRLSHLFLGTQADNMADKTAKGRARGNEARGEAHNQAKLSEADVRQIRRLAADGMTQRAIAACFGVKQRTVWAIVHRVTWSHVDAPEMRAS